jgi:predicted kinase
MTARRPVLIHLNGPSGVGKSTLAQRYVDDHPGVLNLEIDTIASLIGCWRDDFFAVLPRARSIAIAMADTHLREGQDVIMPQLVTSLAEAARFEVAAADAGAEYIEVVLAVEPTEQIRRFQAKSQSGHVNAHIERFVAARGGGVMLRRIHAHVDEYAAHRPAAIRLSTTDLAVESSYAKLLELLGSRAPHPC